MSEVGTDYWSKDTGDLFKYCKPYRDLWGDWTIENDRYKVKKGRFWQSMWSPAYKGYKKVNGKWLYVTTYDMSIIDNINSFLHQMEHEYEQPSKRWNVYKRLKDPKIDL